MSDYNILFIYEDFNLRALTPIINQLKAAGFTLDLLEASGSWMSDVGVDRRDKAIPIIEEKRQFDYLFGVVVAHNGNPSIRKFQKEIRPKYGYYDIEHDIFSYAVETSPTDCSLGSFAFTKQHRAYLQEQGRKYFEAQWYKLDDITNEPYNENAPLDSGILVYSMLQDTTKPFEFLSLFQDVYLKNFLVKGHMVPLVKGLVTNLEHWWDAQAIVDMRNRGVFWFSKESSAIIEALLLYRIPVLWQTEIVDEKPTDNPVVSSVLIKDSRDMLFHNFENYYPFITSNNFEEKYNKLISDKQLRQDTIKLLRAAWCYDEEKPKVGDILIADMQRHLNQ